MFPEKNFFGETLTTIIMSHNRAIIKGFMYRASVGKSSNKTKQACVFLAGGDLI